MNKKSEVVFKPLGSDGEVKVQEMVLDTANEIQSQALAARS